MKLERAKILSRAVSAGRLCVVALAVALVAGCGGSTETNNPDLGAENRELRQENERLNGEVARLQGEVERLQGEVEDAQETAEAEPPAAESTAQEDEVQESEPEQSSGGSLAVAGSGDVTGEELPGIMPDDFPLPAGAVADYVSETDYNFALDFVIDTDFEAASAFYDGQLPATGWEETDRTEGTVEGLKGVETSWERGSYIPEGSPQDSDYAQAKERLTLGVYEIEPSGVAVEIFWNDYELLMDDEEDQEEQQSS